jgi:hypothetical protein
MNIKDKSKVSLIENKKISEILLIPGLEKVLEEIRHNLKIGHCNAYHCKNLFKLLEKYTYKQQINTVAKSNNNKSSLKKNNIYNIDNNSDDSDDNESDDDSDDSDYVYESEEDSDSDEVSDEVSDEDSDSDEVSDEVSDKDSDEDSDDESKDESDNESNDEYDLDEEFNCLSNKDSDKDSDKDSMESAFDEIYEVNDEFDENVEKKKYLLWKSYINNKLPVEICVLCDKNHENNFDYVFKTNPKKYLDASNEVFNYLSNNKIECNICGEYLYN